jgi:type II secretory pathway component PulK
VTQVQGLTRANLQSLLDKIAIDDEPVRRNVVNVNTAPSEVLATLPGMTRRLLDAIVNRRQSGRYFQTLGDLLLLEEVDAQALRSLLPVLTTKTSTYIVRVKVRFVGQLSMSAFMAVVEMTEKGPRILQWREVPRLPGWSAWIAPPQMPQPGEQNRESAPESPL